MTTTTMTCPNCAQSIPCPRSRERLSSRLIAALAIAILGGMLLFGMVAIGFLFVGVSH
jgi:hypothetical protein